MSTKGVYDYDSTQDRLTQIADYSADQLSDIVNVYGAKNLLKCTLDDLKAINNGTWNGNVLTISGVSFTVNIDENGYVESITVDGTNSSTRISLNLARSFVLPINKYIASCEGLDNATGLFVDFAEYDNAQWKKDHIISDEPITFITQWKNCRVNCFVNGGASITNITFKPMIRLASIEDDTYVPYAMTNQQLTGLYDNEVEMGAVNLLPFPYTESSKVGNGITFNVNSDGTISVSGTASSNTTFILAKYSDGSILNGKKISGLNIADTSAMIIKVEYDGSPYTEYAATNGTPAIISGIPSGVPISIFARVYQGKTVNTVIKPMLTLASQPNSDYAHYVPYAKSNKELTDDSANKIDLTSINITSGTTNNTGSTIASSTFFYYKGSLVRAKTDIANGATLTENTNYEVVTAGGLNALNSDLLKINAPEFISHNIPRLIPKDISAYIADGSFWNRLNGTGGYSLFEDIFVGDYVKMSRAITAPNQDSQYATTGSQYITLIGLDTRMGDGDGGDSVSVINYHHSIWTAGQGFGGTQHFGRKRMNSSNITTGGYVNSEMFIATIGSAVSSGSIASGATINQQLYAEFGSHLKKTRELLTKTINATAYNRFGTNSGASSDWAWATCQAVLMSEVEVYGSTVWSSSGYDTGNANKQFPLFAFSKEAMNNRSAYYWLKDVASGADFCLCRGNGYSDYGNASRANGCVRPRFILA